MIKVELQEWMGSDAAIANAAWTSTYDKSRREDKYDDPAKVAAIVRRMAQDGHAVPFESVVLRFWIRMPIYTDRQHMTHRIASHNGLSGRYRTMPSDFMALPADVRDILEQPIADEYTALLTQAHASYARWLSLLRANETRGLITNGQYKRCREILRGVLGTAFMTERTTVMNLRSFANYVRLRHQPDAQAEIAQVAGGMLEAVRAANVCPVAMAALEAVGWRI